MKSFCLCMVMALPSMARPAQIVTAMDGSGDFADIQSAVDAASDGDTVMVLPGKYSLAEPLTFRGKAIGVVAAEGPRKTVLRLSGYPNPERTSVVIFESHETQTSSLEGFTITGGKGTGEHHLYGGGIFCTDQSSPAVVNCVITGNSAGGVVCFFDSAPTLTGCTVSGNSGFGIGSFWESSPSLADCIVWGNEGESFSLDDLPASTVDATHCCIQEETWPGAGNINLDPLFCGWAAAEVHVDSSASGPGDGTGARPFPDLGFLSDYSMALSAGSPCLGAGTGGGDMGASLGTCGAPGPAGLLVLLEPGRYDLAGRSLLHGVSIRGSGRDTAAIVGTVRGLRTGAMLSGLTVTGGTEGGIIVDPGQGPEIKDCAISGNTRWDDGGGLDCGEGSFPTISGCEISGNSVLNGDGGGVYCLAGSSPVLTGCTITGNSAEDGGGVWCSSSSPILKNCTISGNQALDDGGGVYCVDSSPTLEKCLLSSNRAGDKGGGVLCYGSSPALSGCTISGNQGRGLDCRSASSPALADCIVWGNMEVSIHSEADSTPTVTFSCIQGQQGEPVWPGAGNIDLDPLFCGWVAAEVYVDASGEGPGDGTVSYPHADLAAALDFNLALSGESPCLGTGRGGSDMGAGGRSCENPGAPARLVHVAAGMYPLRGLGLLHGATLQGAGEEQTIIEGTLWGLSTGTSVSGVTVTSGTPHGICISSGQSPEIRSCTIARNPGSGLYTEGSPVLVDCTITENLQSGVACLSGSPRLADCKIVRNYGGYGGTRFEMGTSPVLEGCAISGNSGFACGGVYLNGVASARLDRCTITGNYSKEGGGGGLYTYGASIVMSNCVVWGNLANYEGAISNGSPALELVNCTVTGNAHSSGMCFQIRSELNSALKASNCIVWGSGTCKDVFSVREAGVQVDHSCIQGGWPGTGNVSGDPLLVSPGALDFTRFMKLTICGAEQEFPDFILEEPDLGLNPGSPCLDTGTPEGAPALDIEGHRRPCGEGVDMGAHESGDCPAAPTFRRGDTDGSGTLDLTDVIRTLNFQFVGGITLNCLDAADSDDSGILDLTDAIYSLTHQFIGGPPPPAPFPDCGSDDTPDALDCAAECI